MLNLLPLMLVSFTVHLPDWLFSFNTLVGLVIGLLLGMVIGRVRR
ncbi:MAG TPA: hypothetical protein VHB98_14405 [Chloroflexota bacterium]|jgi:hypothetical protein|nr:hypothetical protein [Chloroflexota bacterium]